MQQSQTKRNSELNVNASEFISILMSSRPSSASSSRPSSVYHLNPQAPEFTLPPSPTSTRSSLYSSSLYSSSLYSSSLASSFNSPPPCNIQTWWFENQTLFDDSYDDMKKIFGWSKVPIKKIVRVGELSKLNVEMERPSKKVTECLTPIKEETSYAGIVLRNTLHAIRVQN